FQQFSRIDEIPEPYRVEVRRKGSHIYHQLPRETFAWLSKRSLRHRANVVSDASVVISALDTSKASLEAFRVKSGQTMSDRNRVLSAVAPIADKRGCSCVVR